MRAQLAAFAVGVWLTASPDVLNLIGPARTTAHIAGPLAAMFALIAAFEVTRGVRWMNVAIGTWLVFAPWVMGYTPADIAHSTAVGLALAGLGCIRGRVQESFGGGWRALWKPA